MVKRTLVVLGILSIVWMMVWGVARTNKVDGARQEKSLAEELEECLPKSDMGSKQKCDQLLAQINNFEECQKAGFAIRESFPPTCATVDGRVFTQDITADKNAYTTTLYGRIGCLPKTTEISTLECAIGLKTDTETYYALIVPEEMNEKLREIQTGKAIQVEGVLTPKEKIGRSQWNKYDIAGAIVVAQMAYVEKN